MTLGDELKAYAKKTHADEWTRRQGQKVPEADDLGLGNDAVMLDGTVLYADLAESSGLVRDYPDYFAAEVYKNYLYCAARVIRSEGGTITAYDGDRVMAVFIGGSKNTSAARAALKINYVAQKILGPAIHAQYPRSGYTLQQKVGIDSSQLFVARTGIRGSNDLVWVGNSANNAAKMAALPTTYSSYISANVYGMLHESVKYGGDPKRDMWTDLRSRGYAAFGSTWYWTI